MKTLLLLLITFGACIGSADARVYALRYDQTIFFPDPDFRFNAPKVAIDGDAFIALVDRDGGRSALLYRRAADGVWVLSRTLLDADGGTIATSQVAMADGVAAVRLDDVLHIYERVGTEWTESATAGTPRPAPGLSISARRILVGRRGCNYDVDVYEKSLGSGVWRINGRLSGAVGECNDHGAAVDHEGDVALVRNPNAEVREYRRSGATWTQVGAFTQTPDRAFGFGPVTLSGATAVAPGGATFQRVGSAWNFVGRVQPLDYLKGVGGVREPDLRGSVLGSIDIEDDLHAESRVYLYRATSAGQFEHSAVLHTPGSAESFAASGNTVVAGSNDYFGDLYVSIFTVPPPANPGAFSRDFDDRDVTGFQQTAGSQFALADTGSNFVFRQSATAAEAHAVMSFTDWNTQQYVEADITPTAFDGNDRWFGLAVRYLDAANHYYVTLRGSNVIQLKRMVNGVFTTLAEHALPVTLNRTYHVQLRVDHSFLTVYVDGSQLVQASDTSLTHGRTALMTYRTRADFDNVFAGASLPFEVAYKDMTDLFEQGRGFTETGTGSWTPVEDPRGEILGRAQTSTAGDARATGGTPLDDQVVRARLRLDQYGASPSGAWFGLFARYVDPRTHYYLSVRSSGELQIRRQLAGGIAVLASTPFTVNPGEFHNYELAVIGDQLHAYVDGVYRLGAHDDNIARGQYGIGMYRTASTVQLFVATQP